MTERIVEVGIGAIGVGDDGEEFLEWLEVFAEDGGIDDGLDEVVARDEERVGTAHGHGDLFGRGGFERDARAPLDDPGVEGGVGEEVWD